MTTYRHTAGWSSIRYSIRLPLLCRQQAATHCFPQFRGCTSFGTLPATHIRLQVYLRMYKVTHRSSAQAEFSIPVIAEACSAADWLPEPSDGKNPQASEMAQLDPLYLFACRLLWHNDADAAAAWDLIHGLQSGDQGTRMVASALLTKRRTPREMGAAQFRRVASSSRCGS